ncbi:MAG: SRPBCC domain-containing protein [Pseudomonadota bacterium]
MKKQHFEILIQAPREHVWTTMLQSPTYEQWTSAFCEGSRFEGSWKQGDAIRFLDPAGNGMVSEIAEHRPAQFVSIRHLGFIENGKEDTTSDAVRAWAPCYENYTFTDENGGTRVKVDTDVFGDYEDMMARVWPQALQSLKNLCEGTN